MSNAIAEDGFSEQLQEANSQLSQLGARIAIPQRSRIDGVGKSALIPRLLRAEMFQSSKRTT